MRDAIDWARGTLLAAAATLLAGCGAEFNAYDGSVRDVARVGTVRGDVNAGNVIFVSVDGKSEFGTWEAPTNKVRVLPGLHRFGVRPQNTDFQRTLRFGVTAGREYLILFKDGAFDVEEVTGRKIDFVQTQQ